MLKIISDTFKNGMDYILEDKTCLFNVDWNGEIYTNGFKNGKDTNKRYKPVYVYTDEDTLEVIGFDEI